MYEQPIVTGKEPSATAEEKEIARKRADEVCIHVYCPFVLTLLPEIKCNYAVQCTMYMYVWSVVCVLMGHTANF